MLWTFAPEGLINSQAPPPATAAAAIAPPATALLLLIARDRWGRPDGEEFFDAETGAHGRQNRLKTRMRRVALPARQV